MARRLDDFDPITRDIPLPAPRPSAGRPTLTPRTPGTFPARIEHEEEVHVAYDPSEPVHGGASIGAERQATKVGPAQI